MLSRALAFVAASAIASLGGCHRSDNPFRYDAGPEPDAPLRVDTDGDGLCDPQEVTRGLRVDDADSDADGYSDLVEVSLGFGALDPGSPERDTIVALEESSGGEARVTFTIQVNGMGETYSGSFQATTQMFSDGIDASTYFAGAGPAGADPIANVYAIDEERQAFVGVHGRTFLHFEVRLAFDGDALGCMRAYPFQYVVKREDGRIVALRRFHLVVVPPGDAPGAGTWCGARPCW